MPRQAPSAGIRQAGAPPHRARRRLRSPRGDAFDLRAATVHGGRGHAQFLRGRGRASAARDGDQMAQVAPLEHAIIVHSCGGVLRALCCRARGPSAGDGAADADGAGPGNPRPDRQADARRCHGAAFAPSPGDGLHAGASLHACDRRPGCGGRRRGAGPRGAFGGCHDRPQRGDVPARMALFCVCQSGEPFADPLPADPGGEPACRGADRSAGEATREGRPANALVAPREPGTA